MTIFLASTSGPAKPWLDALRAALPGDEVRGPGDMGDPAQVEVVLCHFLEAALFTRLTNLKLVIPLRAGIDDLMAMPELRPDIPIARAQEPGGDAMIDEYVLTHVLRHHRQVPEFTAAQAQGEWINPGVKFAAERSVGFLGLGQVGLSAARRVRDVGFKVAAWTRSPKSEPGIESFAGPAALPAFLRRTEILVNVLAVTPATVNMVDAETLAMLPKGASFINVGRGEHVVDADLIAALDSGQLTHATLDVFRVEPLPKDHPYWRHAKVTLMPHTARRMKPERIIPVAVEHIRRMRAGLAPQQQVIRARGY